MKRKRQLGKMCILILATLLWVSTTYAGGLPDKWTEINPADSGFEFNGLTPSCSCAPGTPDDEFSFFVKGGKRNNIVIFFDGGGACWDAMNCLYAPTYTQYQDEELSMFSDAMEGFGIFDQTRKENPFKDWGFVFVPYCTGDLFWGANDATYDGATIKHRGFVNFQAVLKYLEENTNYPGKIFVTGSSAGSYGATLAFPYVKKSFPWSNAYLLGDAGSGVMGGSFQTEGILNWNVQMPEWIFPEGYLPNMDMAEVYTAIAEEYPWNRFAQYTTAYDGTQIYFYNVMLNIDSPWLWGDITPILAGTWNYTMQYYAYSTAAASPNYRYYIASGTDHTIMTTSKFFTEMSGGVPFSDWVNSMIQTPNKWENQQCDVCLP